MNNLQINLKEYEGKPVVSSREIATNFEKQHKHVLESIENLKAKILVEKSTDLFIESKYQHPQNKQWYKEYLITEEGVKCLYDSARGGLYKNQLGILYNQMVGGCLKFVMMPDRYETTFFNKLRDILLPLGIELETQKSVLNYRLDGYISQFNLAIEYDEKQHRVNSHKKLDMQRENRIKEILGCKFVRLNYENTDAFNIGLVIKNIFNL